MGNRGDATPLAVYHHVARNVLAALVLGFVILTTAPSYAQSVIGVQAVVKDRSSNASIPAVIYSRTTCPTWQDSCKSLGKHEPNRSPARFSCEQGTRLFAHIVEVGGYVANTNSVDCYSGREPIVFLAFRINDVAWLTQKGDALLTQGKANDATVFFSAANYLQPSQEKFEKTLKAGALAVGVNPDQALVYDPQQTRRVASPELVHGIKRFQAEKGIVVDGLLGSETIKKLTSEEAASSVISRYATEDHGG